MIRPGEVEEMDMSPPMPTPVRPMPGPARRRAAGLSLIEFMFAIALGSRARRSWWIPLEMLLR